MNEIQKQMFEDRHIYLAKGSLKSFKAYPLKFFGKTESMIVYICFYRLLRDREQELFNSYL